MQTTTFLCPLPIPKHPYPKNSAIMIRNDFKWEANMLSHLGLIIHSWGRTSMSISNKGRLINSLYKTTHPKNHIFMEKTT